MNRLEQHWKQIRTQGRKALIPFITAGDPNLAATKKLISALEKGGGDIIELGIPFSDPMADGPVIQKASERALKRGTTLKKILRLVREVRRTSQVPILLMGYYNPILAYGLKNYARDAARAGVDATLVVDLPPEESGELDRELKRAGIDLIYLLTPTSGLDRIRLVARKARGFIYFVSITGVTGARLAGAHLKLEEAIRIKIVEIRRHTKLPIAVGFGISTPDQVRRIGQFAEGVVIGSALVSLIHQKKSSRTFLASVEKFISGVKSVL